MMRSQQIARIKLHCTDVKELNRLTSEIARIAQKAKTKIRGPIALPTRRLRITTRKSPCGEGTETWEHYELRIHKRLVDIPVDDRTMRDIVKLHVPRNVNVEIELKEIERY